MGRQRRTTTMLRGWDGMGLRAAPPLQPRLRAEGTRSTSASSGRAGSPACEPRTASGFGRGREGSRAGGRCKQGPRALGAEKFRKVHASCARAPGQRAEKRERSASLPSSPSRPPTTTTLPLLLPDPLPSHDEGPRPACPRRDASRARPARPREAPAVAAGSQASRPAPAARRRRTRARPAPAQRDRTRDGDRLWPDADRGGHADDRLCDGDGRDAHGDRQLGHGAQPDLDHRRRRPVRHLRLERPRDAVRGVGGPQLHQVRRAPPSLLLGRARKPFEARQGAPGECAESPGGVRQVPGASSARPPVTFPHPLGLAFSPVAPHLPLPMLTYRAQPLRAGRSRSTRRPRPTRSRSSPRCVRRRAVQPRLASLPSCT